MKYVFDLMGSNPMVVYLFGMSLTVILAGIFSLSIWYYLKAKDLAPRLRTIKVLEAEIKRLKTEYNSHESKLAWAEGTIRQGQEAEKWLNDHKEIMENLQKDIIRLREELEPLRIEHERLSCLISEKQKQADNEEKRAIEAENRLRQAELSMVAELKKHNELSVNVANLESKVRQLTNDIVNLNEKRDEYNKLSAEVESLEATRKRLLDEIKTLEVLKRTLNDTLDKIRVEIETGKRIIARGDAMRINVKNMWNDLERPVAAIIGCSGDRWAAKDENVAIDAFAANLEAAHYKFHPRTIKAFHTGLLCGDISPMLVLAGISGTGKSLLPELYATQFNMNFLPVAVQPRWDGPQDMFGFYNHMEERYKATELSRLIYQFDRFNNDLAKKAYAQNSALPMSIVLLDEMNLARIEYYFSELLSKLEIRRNVINPANSTDRFKSEIELEYGAPSIVGTDADKQRETKENSSTMRGKRLYVGRHILFVGTMNEDESTQTLSGKVIDRSNVLRFGVPRQLEQSPDRKVFDDFTKKMVLFDTWMQWASRKGTMRRGMDLDSIIKKLNLALDSVDRGFGHRTETAIQTYVDLYPGSKEDAIADQIAMKILPRLNGVEKDRVQQYVASTVNDVLSSIRAEDEQRAFDNVVQDDKSTFFAWKGVNR